MPEARIRHATREELLAGLEHILKSPSDNGVLEGIVTRPEPGKRVEVESCDISIAGGVAGDHWANGSWMSTDDGLPHPDVQVSIMNTRCLGLIARERHIDMTQKAFFTPSQPIGLIEEIGPEVTISEE